MHYYHSLSVFPQRDSIHFAMRGCSALPQLSFRRLLLKQNISWEQSRWCPHQGRSRSSALLGCSPGAWGRCRGSLCGPQQGTRGLHNAQDGCDETRSKLGFTSVSCCSAAVACFNPQNPCLGYSFPLCLLKLFPPLQSCFLSSLPSTLTLA